MNAQEIFQERLRQGLLNARAKNSLVSVRSYAKQIKVPASTVSLILLGKRKVSRKLALKLADVLHLDPGERLRIEADFEKEARAKSRARTDESPHERSKRVPELFQNETVRLTEEQFDLLGEWYYFGILSLVQTKDFVPEPTWIASRLGIHPEQAKNAFEKLCSLKLISVDAAGKAKREFKVIRTSDGKSSASLRAAHFKNLSLFEKALRERPFEACDATFINLPVRIGELDQMKLKIRKFHESFLESFTAPGDADEVIRVCVNLFPVTTPLKAIK